MLTREEVAAVLEHMSGMTWLMAGLLYGAGLCLVECVRLRVQDVDFARREITVRQGKGGKDRRTMPPALAVDALQGQLGRSEASARTRFGRRFRRGMAAARAGAQISERGTGMGLAVRVSSQHAQHRST